jgi:hypothetical protein
MFTKWTNLNCKSILNVVVKVYYKKNRRPGNNNNRNTTTKENFVLLDEFTQPTDRWLRNADPARASDIIFPCILFIYLFVVYFKTV